MSNLALVGIDLGKHTFHMHGQDKPGRELFRKKLSRQQMMRFFANLPACTVVMEACAGAHFVARELTALGHQAKLISPQFVKPFVKGNKNDFVDAQAICEAASRPTMRFVSPKTEGQQYSFSIASAARIADPRPHQGGQPDARFLARVRYQSAARPGRDETPVGRSGGA
ncbi:Transposase for insertion sequence element IS1328 [Pseudomonas syringae group genomosp. 3]|uniref:Transposase for insertion sequence element IS1328 n=1 Tax=Pseudomonas syringae group genomosp. 3 TaxID=251701 RepID=A0A2K4WBG4_9PSED|nr:Transposase for insertion sequence element IS1328 [Pseudomonas syringae group genomosp. 3]